MDGQHPYFALSVTIPEISKPDLLPTLTSTLQATVENVHLNGKATFREKTIHSSVPNSLTQIYKQQLKMFT